MLRSKVNNLGKPRKKSYKLSIRRILHEQSIFPRLLSRLIFFISLCVYYTIVSTSVYQAIHEAKLEKKLEHLLLKLLEHNTSPNVQEPIRQFLVNYQVMSDSFWERYEHSNTFEEVLECYYQFSKNQCTIVETLLENLKFTLDKDNTRSELAMMLKDAFTFQQ